MQGYAQDPLIQVDLDWPTPSLDMNRWDLILAPCHIRPKQSYKVPWANIPSNDPKDGETDAHPYVPNYVIGKPNCIP